MKKMWMIGLAMLGATLLMLSGAAVASEVPAPVFEEQGPPEQSSPAPEITYNEHGMPRIPDFTLPGSEGAELTLSSLLGKKIILNFWASWCPPCQAEMGDFQRFYMEKVLEGGPYALLSINLADGVQETREKSAQFMQEHAYTFPVYYDETGMVFSMFSNGSIPVTVVVDEEGFLVNGVIGMTNYETIVAMLGDAE